MTDARIAVVTVTWNAEEMLPATIRSVVAQGFDGLEYVIVDGASSDGTVAVIRAYEQHLAAWISEPDDGIADAFNKGIAMTTAPLIALVNAGDTLLPGALELMWRHHAADPEAVLCGCCVMDFPRDGRIRYRPNPEALEREMTVHHPAVLVPRALYRHHGGFDRRFSLAMDYELLLRFRRAGARFTVVDADVAVMDGTGLSEVGWIGAYRQVVAAKVRHGCPSWSARTYFWFMVCRRLLRTAVYRGPMRLLIGRLRGRFSVVGKEPV